MLLWVTFPLVSLVLLALILRKNSLWAQCTNVFVVVYILVTSPLDRFRVGYPMVIQGASVYCGILMLLILLFRRPLQRFAMLDLEQDKKSTL
jgi:hypothetical protein